MIRRAGVVLASVGLAVVGGCGGDGGGRDGGGALIRPGTAGSFEVAWPPGGADVRVWYDAPAEPAEAPVLVVMPGRQRNGEIYRDEWSAEARARGALLLVPELPEALLPGDTYNLAGMLDGDEVTPPATWAFNGVEHLFDAAVEAVGGSQRDYLLYGHSAGAQFVHRLVLLQPGARVGRAVAANAGWYTVPDADEPFPYGLDGAPWSEAVLDRALALPLTVLLGEEDDDPDASGLRTTEEAMVQGETRLERGRWFFDRARRRAELDGVTFGWGLAIVPGVGHENAEMVDAAAALLFG